MTTRRVSELVHGSDCATSILLDDRGRPRSWCIEISGELAALPSTSNSKQIYARRDGRRFIGKNRAHIDALEALTLLVAQACLDRGHSFPRFGDEVVHVLIICGDRPGRWDSHNLCKPVGDWLQDIGCIEDDSRAEIHAVKAHHMYGRGNYHNTFIIVHSLGCIRSSLGRFLHDILGSADPKGRGRAGPVH